MSTPYYEDDTVTLHHGDALGTARALPDQSAQTIVTSPPYFGLRDYGEDRQIGAEASVDEYVAALVGLFRELRRVLADDGTLWLNLGDSYAASSASGPQGRSGMRNGRRFTASKILAKSTAVPAKNLIGVPWRVAFALQSDGWILRSDVIWAKPNAMPESARDRPSRSHEYVFLLSKRARYFYDAEAIREPYAGDRASSRRARAGGSKANSVVGGYTPDDLRGSNKRTVWQVPTQPFAGAHFATFPSELVRPCVLAGSRPGDVVLDPFSGSGTTGMVATQEGRRYVGIDLNAQYLDLSLRTRFAHPVLNMTDWDGAA